MRFDRAVFVHGGMQGSWCWERVLPALRGDAVAVDLPGRPGAAPIPATLASWADTVIEASGSRSVVVAHSLGGLAALAAASRAPERIAGIVFVAAVIPPRGHCYWDLLSRPHNMARRMLRIGEPDVTMTKLAGRLQLCNGLNRADRDRIVSQLVPESGAVLGTPVDYALADSLDLTYVHTDRDRMVRPSQQRRYVGNLPNRTRRLRLDCGHSVSYARPVELARIVDRRLLNRA